MTAAKGVIGLWLFMFLLCSVTTAHGQRDEVEFQTWSDFTMTYQLNQNSAIGGDAGVRGMASNEDWNLFYIRPTYKYSFNKSIRLAGSMAFFTPPGIF